MFLKELYDDVFKTKHTTFLNCNRLTEIEKAIQEKERRINELEKRINNIADYIQGPYTQQINKTFAELTQQINENFDNIYKNKPLPCTKSTKKISKKKGK